MLTIFFTALSVIFIVYGALITTGKFVPPTSRYLVEEEDLSSWCKAEGVNKILWGLDIAFLTMYIEKLPIYQLWIGIFLVLTVIIIIRTYQNNQKYMK